MADEDPAVSNPQHCRTVFENEYVRVLDYTDASGEHTTPHVHPNGVMITLTDFDRRLGTAAGERDVALRANRAFWLPAQRHAGANIGATPTHATFVELKEAAAGSVDNSVLGPQTD